MAEEEESENKRMELCAKKISHQFSFNSTYMVIIDHQAGIRFLLLAFTVKGETVFRVIGVR